MCFFAGANSIFYGDKLLTTGNPEADADRALLGKLGMTAGKPEPFHPHPQAQGASCGHAEPHPSPSAPREASFPGTPHLPQAGEGA